MRIYITLILALTVFTGCLPLPLPHTSERFHAIRGHIVDAVTGQPISGVVIAIHDHPSTTTMTDANGAFYISKQRNYHYGVAAGICATSWPAGSRWSDLIDITHPGYEPCQTNAYYVIIPTYGPSDKPYELQNIPLTPKPR